MAWLLVVSGVSAQAAMPTAESPPVQPWACAAAPTSYGVDEVAALPAADAPLSGGAACEAATPPVDQVQALQIQQALGTQVSPVPEPPAYALMLAGLAVIGLVLHRRRPPRD